MPTRSPSSTTARAASRSRSTTPPTAAARVTARAGMAVGSGSGSGSNGSNGSNGARQRLERRRRQRRRRRNNDRTIHRGGRGDLPRAARRRYVHIRLDRPPDHETSISNCCLGGDNDLATINAADGIETDTRLRVDVDAGQGDDEVAVELGAVADDAQFNLKARLGAGNDLFDSSRSATLARTLASRPGSRAAAATTWAPYRSRAMSPRPVQ